MQWSQVQRSGVKLLFYFEDSTPPKNVPKIFLKHSLLSLTQEYFFEKNYENFNISENNIISVEVAKLWHYTTIFQRANYSLDFFWIFRFLIYIIQ
jgi:hypothetical protein